MNRYEESAKEFHQAMEMEIGVPFQASFLALRQRLINEEVGELNVEVEAMCRELEETGHCQKETILRMYKELADLQYVVSSMVVSFNIPMEKVFERVHQSNMSKLVNGKPLKRADGKALKGPNYKKPVLDDLI